MNYTGGTGTPGKFAPPPGVLPNYHKHPVPPAFFGDKTMKIEVYSPEKEHVTRLALSRRSNGSVVLLAVDASGNMLPFGHLLTILPDGYIKRTPHINPQLGFPLDLMGRLVFAEDNPE